MQWGSWGAHEFTGGTIICDPAPGHVELELSALRADFEIETDVRQGSQPTTHMPRSLILGMGVCKNRGPQFRPKYNATQCNIKTPKKRPLTLGSLRKRAP